MHHVVYQQTHLLFNRHLDQILLSALYGVCKVNQLRLVSFKEIIAHYKRQPQSKSDIFRSVSISQSQGPAFQVQSRLTPSLPLAPTPIMQTRLVDGISWAQAQGGIF